MCPQPRLAWRYGHHRERRPRAQPQGRHRDHSEGTPHRRHRPVRFGQVVARVRHDRRRVAAPAERDVHDVRPQPAAALRPTRRRRHRQPAGRHRGRPEADRRQQPLHGRHDHRPPLAAAAAVVARRPPVRRLLERVLVQRPRRHVPALPGPGHREDHRPRRAGGPHEVAERGRHPLSHLPRGWLDLALARRPRVVRQRQAARRVHRRRVGDAAARRFGVAGARRHPRHHAEELRGSAPPVRTDLAAQGRRDAARADQGGLRAGGHPRRVPRLRRNAAERGSPVRSGRRPHDHRVRRDGSRSAV